MLLTLLFILTPSLPTYAKSLNLAIAIHESKSSLAQAQSLEEWKRSKNHPENLFKSWLSSQKQICLDLGQLNVEDYLHFESAIRHQATDPCFVQVLERIQNHWIQASLKFNSDNPRLRALNVGPRSNHTLPSREQPINPKNTKMTVSGNLAAKEIAITFDDGPDPIHTPEILEILKSYGVRSNIFEIGEHAKLYPNLSRQVVDTGHILGSHTHSHPQLTKMTLADAENEMTLGHEEVMRAGQVQNPFFRFPYGAFNPPLREIAANLGWTHFFWNMDSLDWKFTNPDELYKNVIHELDTEKRGIILFHDIHGQTAVILPRFLEELKTRAYSTVVFIPVTEPMGRPHL